jgi:hypothetical protein
LKPVEPNAIIGEIFGGIANFFGYWLGAMSLFATSRQ